MKALVLRNCKSDLNSHGGFTLSEKGAVEAPDWNDRPECGGGFHGLISGRRGLEPPENRLQCEVAGD